MSASSEQMPEALSSRRIGKRLLQIAAVVLAVALIVRLGPGLGTVRERISHAAIGWLGVGVALEVLSALSYVVVFRAVFCRRMSWRLSYQIGMAEQAANSVLSVSGAGGLALGAWALRRGGMSVEFIGRRTVAFFFLTSLANVGGVILFALLYLVGVLPHDRNAALTYGFGGGPSGGGARRGAPTAPGSSRRRATDQGGLGPGRRRASFRALLAGPGDPRRRHSPRPAVGRRCSRLGWDDGL